MDIDNLDIDNFNNGPFHIWYSEQADKEFGHSIYIRENGERVKVTNASRNFEFGINYLWPDKVYLGTAVRCVEPNGRSEEYRFRVRVRD